MIFVLAFTHLHLLTLNLRPGYCAQERLQVGHNGISTIPLPLIRRTWAPSDALFEHPSLQHVVLLEPENFL